MIKTEKYVILYGKYVRVREIMLKGMGNMLGLGKYVIRQGQIR